jgi:hypothetical protein
MRFDVKLVSVTKGLGGRRLTLYIRAIAAWICGPQYQHKKGS